MTPTNALSDADLDALENWLAQVLAPSGWDPDWRSSVTGGGETVHVGLIRGSFWGAYLPEPLDLLKIQALIAEVRKLRRVAELAARDHYPEATVRFVAPGCDMCAALTALETEKP